MRLKGWHVLIVAVLAVLAWPVYWYYRTHDSFRFRLAMEIEADGKVHAGSSIIEVTYSPGGINTKRWLTSVRGVTPMVDLGRQGTVMAAFTWDAGIYVRKLAAVGRPVGALGRGLPTLMGDLPLAVYNRPPEQLISSLAKAEVPLQQMPALIWMPHSAHWRSAQAILPEEMPSVIDGNVRFIRMTIEPTPSAKLITRINPPPDWLVMMRNDKKTSHSRTVDQFNFHPLLIESEYPQ